MTPFKPWRTSRPMHWTFVKREEKVASMDFVEDEETLHANRIR
jgi:hypothetical protein